MDYTTKPIIYTGKTLMTLNLAERHYSHIYYNNKEIYRLTDIEINPNKKYSLYYTSFYTESEELYAFYTLQEIVETKQQPRKKEKHNMENTIYTLKQTQQIINENPYTVDLDLQEITEILNSTDNTRKFKITTKLNTEDYSSPAIDYYITEIQQPRKKENQNMENKQILKDLTISANRIKKANYNKYGTYQNYLTEESTANKLKEMYTKEQLNQIKKAYLIINQVKLNLANNRQDKLDKAYGKEETHISELSTEQLEHIKKQQDKKRKGEQYPKKGKNQNHNQITQSGNPTKGEKINMENNQIYTGINLITINPITKPNLGIQFQDKWYNTITELEHILEPDTTYNLQYITDYDSDTQQTEKYYIIKEVK